jgi:hypothetical protein
MLNYNLLKIHRLVKSFFIKKTILLALGLKFFNKNRRLE